MTKTNLPTIYLIMELIFYENHSANDMTTTNIQHAYNVNISWGESMASVIENKIAAIIIHKNHLTPVDILKIREMSIYY